MSTPPPPGPPRPPTAAPCPPPAPHGPGGARGGPAGDDGPAATDGTAVAALVLGVLCFLPAAGLVLGVIALRRTGRRGGRGRRAALAGSALSALGLVLWTASLTTGLAPGLWDRLGGPARPPVALDRGDCFDTPAGLQGTAYDVDRVPCSGRHDGEVFAVVTLPGGPYPGGASVTGTADERCYALEDTYAMDPWAVPGNVGVYFLLPSPESWRLGDREITCVFGDSRPSGRLTGSLRRDEATLDPHQTAFLRAARHQDRALARAPEEERVEGDLPGHREWARTMAAALGRQTRALRGHDWPEDARGPVAVLAADLERARGEWLAAARADDTGAYHEHHDAALGLAGPPRSVTARKALGLAVAPPVSGHGAEPAGEEPGTRV